MPYADPKDRRAYKRREYYRNREKYSERNRAWRKANPGRKRPAQRRWLAANRERAREIARRAYANHRETRLAAQRVYRLANVDLIREKDRERHARRIKRSVWNRLKEMIK